MANKESFTTYNFGERGQHRMREATGLGSIQGTEVAVSGGRRRKHCGMARTGVLATTLPQVCPSLATHTRTPRAPLLRWIRHPPITCNKCRCKFKRGLKLQLDPGPGYPGLEQLQGSGHNFIPPQPKANAGPSMAVPLWLCARIPCHPLGSSVSLIVAPT